MKRPDLVILVVVWEFLSAFFALIGLMAIFLIAFPAVGQETWGDERLAAFFGMYVGVVILGFYILLAIMAGIGLMAGKEWGRVLSIAHAALSLISIPFGTIIGILVLIYLFKPEVRDYFEGAIPEKTSAAKKK